MVQGILKTEKSKHLPKSQGLFVKNVVLDLGFKKIKGHPCIYKVWFVFYDAVVRDKKKAKGSVLRIHCLKPRSVMRVWRSET